MAIHTFGSNAVDWEERVDLVRLRDERLARLRAQLERSELGALLSFDFANIRYKMSDARSFYNALQVGAVAQPSNRLRAQVSYTFGKSVDDQSSSLGRNEFGNGQARTIDPYNPKLNRGRSDFDVRHSFSANLSWDLPLGPGRAVGGSAKGVGRALLEGWQVAAIFTALSGIPVSPIFTFDQDRDATTDNEQRPDWAPGAARTTPVSRTQLFDPDLFVLPAIGSRGNVGRNVIDGPGLAEAGAATGEPNEIDDPPGRIPGAANAPWNEPLPELPGGELVAYCGSGVSSCVTLHRAWLSGREGRLYPGSWSEWSKRGLPLERG